MCVMIPVRKLVVVAMVAMTVTVSLRTAGWETSV